MNRLGDATSPYLRQHATNPVDWFEWGDDAFDEDLYGEDIIGDLAVRAEEMRRGAAPDSARAAYDASLGAVSG